MAPLVICLDSDQLAFILNLSVYPMGKVHPSGGSGIIGHDDLPC